MKVQCNFMENIKNKNYNDNKFNTNFGILNFQTVNLNKIEENDMINKQIDWVFTIDISGSMEELGSDNKSKMLHIRRTLNNMINYFLQLESIQSTITILIFDSITELLCYKSKINKKFLNEFKYLIKLIKPRNRKTNIEHSLKVSNYNLNKIRSEQNDENCKLIHIFMSDGEITMGETNIDVLKSKLYIDCNNIIIGYGYNDSLRTLEELSNSNKNNEYYFIDALENIGLVCGEIIYNIIYESVRDLKIKISNGCIYDYKDNLWKDSLEIRSLSYDKNRTFHIKHDIYETETEKDMCINNNFSINYEYYDIKLKKKKNCSVVDIVYPKQNYINKYVEKYFWKQIIQISMFTVKKIILQKNNNMKIDYNIILNNYIIELQKYIKENHLQDDEFMKGLYDNLYTCLTSINLKYGYIFINSQIYLQGEERAYNIKNIEKITSLFSEENLNLDLDLNFTSSSYMDISINSTNNKFTSYASDSQINLMKTLSNVD